MINDYYIYFIGSGKNHKFVKIGKSINPKKRMAELQTASPVTISLIHYESVNTEEKAFIIEKELHRIFRKYNSRGEWFYKLPIVGAIEQCSRLKRKHVPTFNHVDIALDIEALESLPVTMQ